MDNKFVRPEDILPDGIDKTFINGSLVRKGTVAAFLANIEILENQLSSNSERNDAIKMMKELAPSVIAIGLHKHVIFKNELVTKILNEEKQRIS